jgi:hypothetical protein
LKQINNEVMICCSLRPRDRILHPSIIHSKSSDIMILPKPHRHLTTRNHCLCYKHKIQFMCLIIIFSRQLVTPANCPDVPIKELHKG